VTSITSPRPSTITILRFDAVQRTVHWLNALMFLTLMFTGLPLYFGSFFGVVFPRHAIQMVHLWTGLALPLPVAIALVGPWGRRMRDDWRRISQWTRAEVRWLRTFGRTALVADKFNPGQKFNAIFTLSAIVVLFVTGYILQWFRFFPVSWRNGATITHDLYAFAVFAMVTGHVVFALANPESLRSMFGGRVREDWARRHAGAWIDEECSGRP
jgi:formate dehydrogenase subunit gamma